MARVARALPPALKCISSTGIAVGTSTEVRHTEDVRYWEGPLSEVPLYRVLSIIDVLGYDGQNFFSLLSFFSSFRFKSHVST